MRLKLRHYAHGVAEVSIVSVIAMFQQVSAKVCAGTPGEFRGTSMLISVLGAGSVTEHGGSGLISFADASESLARSTNGGECNEDISPSRYGHSSSWRADTTGHVH